MSIVPIALLGASLFAAGSAAGQSRDAEANRAFVQYPKESLKRGEEGAVGYRVEIDKRGRPQSCEITQSSGHRRLDLATCEMLMDRAQFTPDGERRRRDVFDGRVVWRIG